MSHEKLTQWAQENDPPSMAAWDLYHPALKTVWRERGKGPKRSYLIECRQTQYGYVLIEAVNEKEARAKVNGNVTWHKTANFTITSVNLHHPGVEEA